MTLSQGSVRAVWLAMAIASTVALWARADVAEAGRARDAIEEARTDLAAQPPRRELARAALERSILAGDDPVALAEAHLRLATLDEEDGAFARAVEHDRAAIAAAPSSRSARTASARIAWLSARSEGDFAPLARLTHFWSDPSIAGDAEALERFAREVDSFPPGTVRGEARMSVAEAWLRRLHRPEEARRELIKVRADPSASTQSTLFAERDLADELLAEGRIDEAESEVHTHGGQLEASFVARVQQLVRRRTLRRAALSELAAFLALSSSSLYVARRRRARGSSPRWRRSVQWTGLAALCALSLVAAAFLVCDAVRPGLLDRLGL